MSRDGWQSRRCTGTVVLPLTQIELDELLAKNRVSCTRVPSLLICSFSFLDDSFERRIESAIKAKFGECFVSRSSTVLPEYKEYERGIATWLNAAHWVRLLVDTLGVLQHELGNTSLQVMQSSGETMSAEHGSAIGGKSIAVRPRGRTYCNRLSWRSKLVSRSF